MPRTVIALALLVACSSSADDNDSYRFGLIERTAESLHLYTSDHQLEPGTPVTILLSSRDVLSIVRLLDPEADEVATVLIDSKPAVAYLVEPGSAQLPQIVSAVAVLPSPNSLAFPASGLRPSNCSSSEGIHHSIWLAGDSGETRLWSAYRHLDYAVEPDCSDAELAE